MAKMLLQKDVLTYHEKGRSNQTVRRHYLEWRSQQKPPIPYRCDNRDCKFYKSRLKWNGKDFGLILDHINGVHANNRPENLQFLCPNCNSQQPTHGGRNIGRVKLNSGGYAIVRKNGKLDYTLIADPGEFKITGGTMSMYKGKSPYIKD